MLVLLAAPIVALSAHGAAPVESCIAESWPLGQLKCLRQVAIDAGDPGLCLRSNDPAVRWQCVAAYAEHARDPSRCEILPPDDLEPAGITRELCRSHLAISWRDPDLCRSLNTLNLADSCLLQLVHRGAGKALCEKIENALIKDACLEG
jgi:hypothetical protein